MNSGLLEKCIKEFDRLGSFLASVKDQIEAKHDQGTIQGKKTQRFNNENDGNSMFCH